MADLSVEEYQRNQCARISREILVQSEKQEQKMQGNAQKAWENAHRHLIHLLRFLDQDYDESCEKANHPLEAFSDNDLAYLIHARLRAVLEQVGVKEKPDELKELRNQLEKLNQKYSELEQINSGLLETSQKLQTENDGFRTHLFALQQAHKSTMEIASVESPPLKDNLLLPSDLIPGWMKTWRETKVFEKTSTVILVMGDTGKALRPSITKEMAKRLALSADNNSLDDAVNRLCVNEESIHPVLIEKVGGITETGSSAGGNPPDVLRLTEDGWQAYRGLTGREPEKNEYDRLIQCHATPEHTILNIQAAEWLIEAGYLIRAQAQGIQLPDSSTFIPDIVAVDSTTGELIFVEVERGVHKNPASRKQKWINLYEVSNGALYIFCDNLNCQRAIQSEINLALRGLAFNSFLTNLHGLRNGKRSVKDGGMWLSVRYGK